MNESPFDLMTAREVHRDGGPSLRTQRRWRATNAYGWADLTIRMGQNVFYRREELRAWVESQKCKSQK